MNPQRRNPQDLMSFQPPRQPESKEPPAKNPGYPASEAMRAPPMAHLPGVYKGNQVPGPEPRAVNPGRETSEAFRAPPKMDNPGRNSAAAKDPPAKMPGYPRSKLHQKSPPAKMGWGKK